MVKLGVGNFLFATVSLFCLVLFCGSSWAQEGDSAEDLFSMSLDEVLDIPVQVASKGITQTQRQASGSISVLDAEYIRNSGARTLQELLATVPGFQFHTDVVGGSIISFRGLWNQGTILLRIDGLEINELLYNSLVAENHYPAAIIERIEIIRGPGSVLYGGQAQHAVIEVTTKGVDSGVGEASVQTGVTEDGLSRIAGTIRQTWGEGDKHVTASASVGDADRGTGEYADFWGQSFEVDEDQDQQMRFFNIGGQYGDFSFRYIKDGYNAYTRDLYWINGPYAVKDEFDSERAELKYETELNDEFSLLVSGQYSYDETWKSNDPDTIAMELGDPDSYVDSFYDQNLERFRGTAELLYSPNDIYSVLVGSSYTDDKGRGQDINGAWTEKYDTDATAVYGQFLYSSDLFTANVGTRYEDDDNYGDEVVSRLSLSKAESRWHAKVQVAESFRAPGFQNVIAQYSATDPNYQIQPETTLVLEGEAGVALGDQAYLTVTLFNVETEDTISYVFDEVIGDTYQNLGDVESQGVEVDLRYLLPRGEIGLWYAYHKADIDNFSYNAIGENGEVLDEDEFAGVSPHTARLSVDLELAEDIRLFSALRYNSKKYGTVAINADELPYAGRLDDEFLWRALLTFEDVVCDNLDVQVGVNNILDEEELRANPTTDYHQAMPALGREFFLNAMLGW